MQSIQANRVYEPFRRRQPPSNGQAGASLPDERGAVLVEAALVTTLLLLLLFGIIEFGIIIFSYNTVASAAREGARFGTVDPAPAGIEAAARARTIGLDPAEMQVDVSFGGGAMPTVTVRVTYRVRLITGLFIAAVGGNPTLTLQSQATMYVE